MKKNVVTAAATAGLILTAFGATASAEEPSYTVRPGDSLWKITQTSHLSINQLKEWNALTSDTIYVNQKLLLTYTVKKGDSLWKIAKENGTTVSQLKRLNGMTSGFLQPGMQLRMAESDISNSSYTIQKGDTLSEIGTRFNLTVTQLKSINQLTSDTIYAGKTLNVSSDAAADTKQTTTASTAEGTNKAESSNAKAPAGSGTATEAASGTTEAAAPADTNETSSEAPVTSNDATPSITSADSSAATSETAPAESTESAPAESTESTPAATPAEPSETTTEKAPATPSAPAQAAAPAAPSTTTTEPAQATSNSTAAQKPAPSTETAQKPATSSASVVEDVIAEAKKYIGSPYKWAGNTPAGFDCSGFTKYVFAKEGITLPRTAATQWDATTPVSSPSVGDLVFFQTYKVGPSHVGIYLGNNKFISAASTGVVISDMTSTYWKTRYLGAKTPY